ncbi:hypothetical protein AVEN_160470-1, partial [Araneus ventricosus]
VFEYDSSLCETAFAASAMTSRWRWGFKALSVVLFLFLTMIPNKNILDMYVVVVVETNTDPAYPKGCKAFNKFNKSVGKPVLRKRNSSKLSEWKGQAPINNSRGPTTRTSQSIGSDYITVAFLN